MANVKIKLPISGIELDARTPKVKDMRVVKDILNDVDRELAMVGNLCQMSPEEVDDLDYKDYKVLQEKLLS